MVTTTSMDSYKSAIAVCTLPSNFGDRDFLTYQDKMLRIYANTHGIKIIRVINEYLDTQYYRYELNGLKSLIKKKIVELVLVQDKCRMFSDYYDFLNFQAFCAFHGVEIISLNDQK